ncbi:hypothetical protein [Lentzea flava]|uniref:Neocarzinostatin family protein n=1 Tax=Lentzea flava TaxID=103732 RepID=A0ABQ2V1M3_9PSEU|nr:hypothetical protein [Lentzea flava]MCP2203098.1 hypothetical protein [Lentzea flava]GGU64748.1 hypothetical protein GCM10010178_65890 [Lentzea flava]
MRRRTIALLAAVATAFVFTPTAVAQDGFTLDRDIYGPHEVVHVSATVWSGCESPVTSDGFEAPIDLRVMSGQFPTLYGSGKTTASVGKYTAQATCNGKVFTRAFEIHRIHPPIFTFSLDQQEYDPGEEIQVQAVLVRGRCPSTVTSPGFAAPIVLVRNPGPGAELAGTGRAVTTPGTYTAEVACPGVPPFTQTFKVKGGPPTTPPPSGSPRPPIVKPKGAPDTGGGSTAQEK